MAQGFDAFLLCWLSILASCAVRMSKSWASGQAKFQAWLRAFLVNGNFASLRVDKVVEEACIFQNFHAHKQEVLHKNMSKKLRLLAHHGESTQMRDKYLEQGHRVFFLLGVSKRVSAKVGRVAGLQSGRSVQSTARGTAGG